MILIEKAQVYNLDGALRGARNPLKSWDKSDSYMNGEGKCVLGPADLNLLGRLCRAGSDHRKFTRQILVSVDLTAPLYWWKEFDTYKIAVTANSTSTMHKIHSSPVVRADFSTDKMDAAALAEFDRYIAYIEAERLRYREAKDKQHWWNIIQMLPSNYNQLRTITMSYENLINMYNARKGHKLDEWHVYCAWIESLPYAAELLCFKPDAPGGAH